MSSIDKLREKIKKNDEIVSFDLHEKIIVYQLIHEEFICEIGYNGIISIPGMIDDGISKILQDHFPSANICIGTDENEYEDTISNVDHYELICFLLDRLKRISKNYHLQQKQNKVTWCK